ncbi:glutamate-rich protein 5 [Trichosurus vulpecula]|uniref:glutamate-rich protein 5 n=1 Tax=Trichosurus vulpecula TaxID=9337 RepID=UPI00186AE159|nr:glutamate-rich protein 5 [Trichosurus vulpecula]
MGCSSSTQTQSQESSRPVTKTGVTNGLKQSASDGNSSIPYENEICLDKTKQRAVEAKVDAHNKTGPTNNLLAGEPRVVKPLAIVVASPACEEGYSGKTGSPGSGERAQTEYPKSIDKTMNPGASEESVPPISARKNELPGTDEKDDRAKSAQPTGKFVEIEIFGTINDIKPLKTASEVEPTETGEHNEHLGMAEKADPQRTVKENKHLGTSEETEPQERVEDIQHVDSDRKTRMLEENDYVGTAGETETSGTLEETEHEGRAGETKSAGTHEETEHEEVMGKTESSGTHEESEHEGRAGETKTSGTMEENEHEGGAGKTKTPGTHEESEHEGRAGETKTSGMVEETEHEGRAGETKSAGTHEETEHEGTVGKTKTSETHEESEHEGTVGKTKTSGTMEETEHKGTAGETEPSETMEKMTLVTGEKNNLQPTVEDNEFPEILGEIQPLGAPGKNDYSRMARGTEPSERVKIQLVETVGGTKPPIIAEGTQENMKPLMEVAREINMNEENQAIEGETGERVETETHSEIVSEGSETKEEETGEAVDTTAATEIELTNSKK